LEVLYKDWSETDNVLVHYNEEKLLAEFETSHPWASGFNTH